MSAAREAVQQKTVSIERQSIFIKTGLCSTEIRCRQVPFVINSLVIGPSIVESTYSTGSKRKPKETGSALTWCGMVVLGPQLPLPTPH